MIYLATAYVVWREGNDLTRVCPSIHPSVCPQLGGGGVPKPGPGGEYPSQVQPGGYPTGVPTLGTPHQTWMGYLMGGTPPWVPPIKPGWGYPTLGTPIRPGWGYPMGGTWGGVAPCWVPPIRPGGTRWGVPHVRYPPPPSDLDKGAVPDGGVPHFG